MKTRFIQTFTLRCKVKGTIIEVVVTDGRSGESEIYQIHSELLRENSAIIGSSRDVEEENSDGK